jgi:hypothetical protein
MITPLTSDDAVQRSLAGLPPPLLRGNGFRVFSAYRGGGSRPPWMIQWSVTEINSR